MELRHLRYFVAVAEERHFGRAAGRLHMAQPPLSTQIRQLETELGVALLTRTTRRVELTDAGSAYLVRARELLAAVDDAGLEAQRIAAGLSGRLAIGCVGSATYTLLPGLARRLREDLPGIDVVFRGELLVPDLVEAVLSGAVDVALLRPPVDEPGVVLRPLRRERLVVAVPDGHPLAARTELLVDDLRGQDLLAHPGRGRSAMSGLLAEMCRAAGFAPRIRHEVAETSTLVTFVAAGLGLAVVPEPVSALRIPGVAYRPLLPETLGVDLAAATRAGRTAPQVARALDVLTALVGAPDPVAGPSSRTEDRRPGRSLP
jgi:DNA-binding transcriptional LysR family regulator